MKDKKLKNCWKYDCLDLGQYLIYKNKIYNFLSPDEREKTNKLLEI